MKVLAFNYEYPPLGGGGGVIFRQIVEALAARHEVTVVTTAYRGLDAHETSGNLEILRVPVVGRTHQSTATLPSMLSYFPSSWLLGRRLLRNRRFDLINSHFVVPSSPSAHLLARQFSLPHVLSIHGGDLYDPSKKLSPHRVPGLRGIVKGLLTAADRLVAQSSNTAANARRYYGIDRSIDIIPLGIDPPRLERPSRREMRIEEDRFVIVTVGRLIARKAIDELLQIVAELADPRVLLLVVGEGPKRGELERLARELGIEDQVRLLGRVGEEEKWKILGVSDLYGSTSLHEGFGLVYLEAFHCGLPVVTYDRGGQTDFLKDGVSGAVVPFGDRDRFVQATRRLIGSAEERRKCAASNREAVREYYLDRCVERYETLFLETIDRA